MNLLKIVVFQNYCSPTAWSVTFLALWEASGHDGTMTHQTLDIAPLEQLRRDRTSAKWINCPDDVLPMFIAEMDFTVAPEIQEALIDQVRRSDLGYANDLTELAEAFAGFAETRWGWRPDPRYISGAPDVSFGVITALRHLLPSDARVALATPVYPSFFGYLNELGFECVEVPLARGGSDTHLDIPALERAFAGDDGPVHAMILSNPHNPHGIAHTPEHLEALARIAAIAERNGTTAIVVSSASKGWNIAGAKCAIVYAPPALAPDSLREHLDLALGYSASILGRAAGTVAFRDAVPWLDGAIHRIQRNAHLTAELLAEHLPAARYTPPRASYLAWIDLRDTPFASDPAGILLREARVNVSDGSFFGKGGEGHIRLNLGCDEDLLREAIRRFGEAATRLGS